LNAASSVFSFPFSDIFGGRGDFNYGFTGGGFDGSGGGGGLFPFLRDKKGGEKERRREG
jgi:hypothetical protein